MQPKKAFGRRPQPEQPRPKPVPAEVSLAQTSEAAPIPVPLSPQSEDDIADVDRELEEWKAARKRYKRSFREPWRTLSIVAAVGFGLSSWLLPDSVADVAQLVTGGMAAASLFAGIRGNWQAPIVPSGDAPQT
jgi:hypothetical protein